MSGKAAKLLRKITHNRKEYQWLKTVYNRSTVAEKLRMRDFIGKK